MAPKLLLAPPASWGQDYEAPDPLQLTNDRPARSRSPVRVAHAAASSGQLRASLLPVGPYVVPRRVHTSDAHGPVLYEARVPEGMHGPTMKLPGRLCIELIQDASVLWAIRLCKRFHFVYKGIVF
jgi:hypothetical protein